MSWKVLVPPRKHKGATYAEADVSVRLGQTYDAHALPPAVANLVNRAWDAHKRRAAERGAPRPEPRPKFRLARATVESSRVTFSLGLTAYDAYIGLRSSAMARQMLRRYAHREGVPFSDFLPNVLGNVGVLITGDRKVIALVRSSTVSTYRGYIDLPGGHPEPRTSHRPSSARAELFRSVHDELAEELGIGRSHAGRATLLAVVANPHDLMTPDLLFILRTALSSDEVIRRAKAAHSDEAKRFVALTHRDVARGGMTPVCSAALSIAHETGLL